MGVNNKTARIAGLLYLIVVLTGIFTLMYVPSKLIDLADPASTYAQIKGSVFLYRLSIFFGYICYLAFLLLPLVLYKLLQNVNKNTAILMVVFAIVSIPIAFSNMGHKLEVLTLIGDTAYLKNASPEALQAALTAQLHAYNNGNRIVSIFWGLWLLPFGYLVFKSGFLPKVLGILLMAGCFSYLSDLTGKLLLPGYEISGLSTYVRLPASLGEIGICLWLLLGGISTAKINPIEPSTV